MKKTQEIIIFEQEKACILYMQKRFIGYLCATTNTGLVLIKFAFMKQLLDAEKTKEMTLILLTEDMFTERSTCAAI